jgi:hypothetical protein
MTNSGTWLCQHRDENEYLDAVYELRQGDVSFASKDVESPEVIIGSVLELEAQKVAIVGKRPATELDDKGRGKFGCKCRGSVVQNTNAFIATRTNAIDGGVTVNHLGLLEKRDEWLVGGRLDEELQRVAIVSDSFQSVDDRLDNCAASDYDSYEDIAVHRRYEKAHCSQCRLWTCPRRHPPRGSWPNSAPAQSTWAEGDGHMSCCESTGDS